MLPDRLTLQPIARFEGTLQLPGSKSLSNRVLLLSALSEGETEVTRVLDSEDTDVMLAGVVVIGAIGLALEKLVFQRLEHFTVVRWGMMT